jgi:hypothetical protein
MHGKTTIKIKVEKVGWVSSSYTSAIFLFRYISG